MIQHPVPPEVLVHIGDITVSFAMLESTIQSFIWTLIHDHQQIGQIITAELSFRNLRALLISLYLERHGEDDDFMYLRELMIRAGNIEEKRNQITHSNWGVGSEIHSVTRIKTTAKEKHGIRCKFEELDPSTLQHIAHEIKELTEEIVRFNLRLMDKGKVFNSPIADSEGTEKPVHFLGDVKEIVTRIISRFCTGIHR